MNYKRNVIFFMQNEIKAIIQYLELVYSLFQNNVDKEKYFYVF